MSDAAQTFNNIPALEPRRIWIAQGTVNYLGMPFDQVMDFPVERTLQTTASDPLLYVHPVRQISRPYTSAQSWPTQPLFPGTDPMVGTRAGEAINLDAQVQPGSASHVVFTLRERKWSTTALPSCSSSNIPWFCMVGFGPVHPGFK
ncbi:MAG TPA: hypothetical protein VOA41_13835 [Candidatus Dormibacteraeota bacterium]|nr:hypothetical protein [Candidatus Dormibacteraeota bacterium]